MADPDRQIVLCLAALGHPLDCFFLVPANFAGFWYLDTPTGFWVAILGAGAIVLNAVPIWLNGGMSKVLALPHLAFWTPLVFYLGLRLWSGELSGSEWWLAFIVFVTNGISLGFDLFDTREWWNGKRQVAGYENEPVRW